MTVRATQTRILVNEFDLSGTTNSVMVNMDANAIEYGVLQQTAMQRLPTFNATTIEHNGYWNGKGAGLLEDEFYTNLGGSGVDVAAIFGTDQTIPIAYVQDGTWNQQMVFEAQTNSLISVNGSWAGGADKTYRGYQVYRGTISATGGTTGIDFGSAGSAGGKAYLFVTTITGTATNATIDVESDTDSGYGSVASEGTFTFSAVGVQELALSGTVNRYVRLNCTDLGSATSFAVVAIVALSGVTY